MKQSVRTNSFSSIELTSFLQFDLSRSHQIYISLAIYSKLWLRQQIKECKLIRLVSYLNAIYLSELVIQNSMRPINRVSSSQEPQLQRTETEQLRELRKMLAHNHKTQEKLKKIRDTIHQRMETINEFISTYRLNSEYPPASGIISYLKFDRSTPHSFREQSKVMEQQEAIKNTTESDCQFMKKLTSEKPIKKKKEIDNINFLVNPKLINFVQLASTSNFKSGLELYRAWCDIHQKKEMKRPFDQRQEQLIILKQRIYGDNWQKVCQFVQTRTFQQIYYEFHNRLNPKIITGRWNYRQSLMLIILCEHYGVKRWAQIAQKMIIKSELQVRERYCNIIDPSVGKNVWTPQLQKFLLEVAHQKGYCWREIAKIQRFKNKTDNCIWRKYRNLMVTHSEEEIQRLMPGGHKKGLIEKILKFKQAGEAKKKLRGKGVLILYKSEPSIDRGEKLPIPSTQNSHLLQRPEQIQEQSQNSLSYIVYS